MRLVVALSAIVSAVATGCGSSSSDGEVAEVEQARVIETGCPILLDFVINEFKSKRERPLHLSRENTSVTPPIGDVEESTRMGIEIERANGRNPDPNAIRKRVEAQLRLAKLAPLQVCPQLQKFSEANSHEPSPDETYPATTKDGLFYHYETLAIEMPFVDFDNGTAEFNVSRVCGPLCGSGSIVTYERAIDGSWKFKDEQGTWIS